jgi:hypothetical protein
MNFSSKGATVLTAVALLLFCDEGRAQESLSELTYRGLDFSQGSSASALVVEEEELTIGLQNIVVKYRLANPTDQPLAAVLTLPFPDLDFSDPDVAWALPAPDPANYVGLSALIEQRPVKFTLNQTANVDGKEIGPILRQRGLPLVPLGAFQNQLQTLPAEMRARLESEGLIAESGTNQAGEAIYVPRWSVRTTASYKTLLAPGQTIGVDLKFRTSVGLSRDSVLREPLRSEKALAREVEERRAQFCIDHAFYGGVDKIVSAAAAKLARPPEEIADPSGVPASSGDALAASARPKAPTPAIRAFPQANIANLRERRVAFDLGAGAGPAPTKSFRLRVDKGKPERLVTFCFDNLRRISPTVFEMEAKDFQPRGVLKILLIGSD